MANVYTTEQHRETDDSLITQVKDIIKTIFEKLGNAVFEVKGKNVPLNKTKEQYYATVSTLPLMKLQ